MKYINLDWFYSFRKLAETGNFNIASNELNITIQTLSYHIRELESYFGLKFIERGNKNNNLTIEGAFLLTQIEDFILSLDSSILSLKENKIDEKENILNIIQSTDCNFDYSFSESLFQLHSIKPKLKIVVDSVLFFEIEKKLSLYNTDLVISSYPINTNNFFSIKLAKIPYVITGKKLEKAWKELKYISCEYHLMRTNYKEKLFYEKYNLESSMTVSSLSVAVAMAKKDLGALYLPILDIEKELILKELEYVKPLEEDYFDIYVILNKSNTKMELIYEYLNILKNTINKALSKFNFYQSPVFGMDNQGS